jgi:hypothetical protein
VERTTIAGETEVLGENLPQRHFVPPQIPHDQIRFSTSDRSGGKPATVHSLLLIGKFLKSISFRPWPLPSKSFPVHHSSSYMFSILKASLNNHPRTHARAQTHTHTCIFYYCMCMLTTQKSMLWNSEKGFCSRSHFWSYSVSWLYQRKMKRKIPLEDHSPRIECFSKFELHTSSR